MKPRLSERENQKLRTLCQAAVDSGDYHSLSALCSKAGLGPTLLYAFMAKRNGVTRATADALRPYVDKYAVAREERKRAERAPAPEPNGTGAVPRLALTKLVLEKLFELYDGTTDGAVRAKIDALIADWAVEGLDVIANAAKQGG